MQSATVVPTGEAEKSQRQRIPAAHDIAPLSQLTGDPEGFDDCAACAAGPGMDLSEIEM